MTPTRVQFPVGGERPRTASGELAAPEGDGKAPAVIVVHEWWGLNDDMRRIATRLAAEGFLAFAVDLYDGRSTTDSSEAMELVVAMKTTDAMHVVRGALAFLVAEPRCTGRVGITGFCLGGGMALAAACNVPGLAAAAPFYGIPPAEHADYSRARVPIQAHFGKKDPIIPESRPEAVLAAVNAGGGDMELFLYDAGHAFLREGDPSAYDAPSAMLAWERLLAFFRARLG